MKTLLTFFMLVLASMNFLMAQVKSSDPLNKSISGSLIVDGNEGKDIVTLEQEGKIIRKNGVVMICKDGCQKYLNKKNKPEEKPKTNHAAGNQSFFIVPKISDQIN